MFPILINKWSCQMSDREGSGVFMLISFSQFVRSKRNPRMEKMIGLLVKTRKVL